VPSKHPLLTFDYRAGWNLKDYPGATLPRLFVVVIEPTGGGTPLWTNIVFSAPPKTKNLDTGPQSWAIDMSAFAGTAVRICFDAIIPQGYAGPGFLMLDNVVLNENPSSVQFSAINFGSAGGPTLHITAPVGLTYHVQASTNLIDWFTIGDLSDSVTGQFDIQDSTDNSSPVRFYRVIAP